MVFVQEKSREKILKRAALLCTRSNSILTSSDKYGHNSAQDEGPLLPGIISPILKARDSQTSGLKEGPHAPSNHQCLAGAHSPFSSPLAQAQCCISLCDTPHVSPQVSHSQSQQIAPQMKTNDLQLSAIEDPLINSNTRVEGSLSATHPLSDPSPMTKEKRAPTRRSLRLQAKKQFNSAASRTSPKTKSQSCKINFTPNSHLSPLDTSKMLEILQATVLLINKQIEELIDEAVKRDLAVETSEQLQLSLTQDQQADSSHHAMPTTPLHDAIPPLAVPETEMLL